MKNNLKKANCTDVTWVGRADCAHCAIRNRVLFSDVPNEDLEGVLVKIDDLVYTAHTALYQMDEAGDYLFTIRRGLVKLVQYLPNGNHRIVRLLKPGDVAGMERIVDEPYQHTAIALQDTEVCRIPLPAIHALEKCHPHLCHQLALRWQHNVEAAEHFITQLSTGAAEARVARLLLYLEGSPGVNRCVVVSREDMGAMLGITTETASRVMADFKRRGIVQESSQHCQCSSDELQHIAQDL